MLSKFYIVPVVFPHKFNLQSFHFMGSVIVGPLLFSADKQPSCAHLPAIERSLATNIIFIFVEITIIRIYPIIWKLIIYHNYNLNNNYKITFTSLLGKTQRRQNISISKALANYLVAKSLKFLTYNLISVTLTYFDVTRSTGSKNIFPFCTNIHQKRNPGRYRMAFLGKIPGAFCNAKQDADVRQNYKYEYRTYSYLIWTSYYLVEAPLLIEDIFVTTKKMITLSQEFASTTLDNSRHDNGFQI